MGIVVDVSIIPLLLEVSNPVVFQI